MSLDMRRPLFDTQPVDHQEGYVAATLVCLSARRNLSVWIISTRPPNLAGERFPISYPHFSRAPLTGPERGEYCPKPLDGVGGVMASDPICATMLRLKPYAEENYARLVQRHAKMNLK